MNTDDLIKDNIQAGHKLYVRTWRVIWWTIILSVVLGIVEHFSGMAWAWRAMISSVAVGGGYAIYCAYRGDMLYRELKELKAAKDAENAAGDLGGDIADNGQGYLKNRPHKGD